jgi:hypothetical protein
MRKEEAAKHTEPWSWSNDTRVMFSQAIVFSLVACLLTDNGLVEMCVSSIAPDMCGFRQMMGRAAAAHPIST